MGRHALWALPPAPQMDIIFQVQSVVDSVRTYIQAQSLIHPVHTPLEDILPKERQWLARDPSFSRKVNQDCYI